MEPARTGRRTLGGRGQTWLDNPQTGAGTLTQRHGCLIEMAAESVESGWPESTLGLRGAAERDGRFGASLLDVLLGRRRAGMACGAWPALGELRGRRGIVPKRPKKDRRQDQDCGCTHYQSSNLERATALSEGAKRLRGPAPTRRRTPSRRLNRANAAPIGFSGG